MTKSNAYAGIRFSADEDKVEKYLRLAAELERVEREGPLPVLLYFTGNGYDRTQHRSDEEKFDEVQKAFEQYLGFVTSLHAMMDLGFPTVKPDRVPT
ncbi:hypothetical protein [Paraburkholderia sp. RL17-337-BIB-A]|uniref:hypothetical protein n=1 Tax=Paraburkholderia sp. RL17-337-BIB-A TaxID=3031636 RepID=UPI0038BADF36